MDASKKQYCKTMILNIGIVFYVLSSLTFINGMEEEHKDNVLYNQNDEALESYIEDLSHNAIRLARRTSYSSLQSIRWQVNAEFFARALCYLNGIHGKLSSIKTPQELIRRITVLLTAPGITRIDARIIIVAYLVKNNHHLLALKDHQGRTALLILQDAFHSLYNQDQRINRSKMPCKNNHYVGTYWALRIAYTIDNSLQNIEQIMFDIIRADSQNPEKTIHLIDYLLSNGMYSAEVLELFDTHDITLTQTYDSNGRTALMLATFNNLNHIVHFLGAAGTNTNEADDITQNTALHYGVEAGNAEAIETLLALGALHTPNASGLYPSNRALQLADIHGTVKTLRILQSLLENVPMDTEQKPIGPELYLVIASILSENISHGPALITAGYLGDAFNPIHMLTLAAENGFNPIIDLFTEAGFDLNQLDKYRFTPLYRAIASGAVSAVERLISAGARDEPISVPKGGRFRPTEFALYSLRNNVNAAPTYLPILWIIQSTNPQVIYHDSWPVHELFLIAMNKLRLYFSIGTAALILSYVSKQFDVMQHGDIGMQTRFLISGPFAQDPHLIYDITQGLIRPEDQSFTVLNALGHWLQASTTLITNNNFRIDRADALGITPFYRAIREGSWQMARILGVAGSRPNAIRALRELLMYNRQHGRANRFAQQRLLEIICILSQMQTNNFDYRLYHNNLVLPLSNRAYNILHDHHQNEQSRQEITNYIATADEIGSATPTFPVVGTAILGIIMSYLMKFPEQRSHLG